jgi:endonuclease/exonuclease/phosphatase family metal-dependent hydrolase
MRIVFFYIFIPFLLILLIFYFWGQSGIDLHVVNDLTTELSQQEDTFSIMTYNLGYLSGMTNNLPVTPPKNLFDKNLIRAKMLVKKLDPDIIGFQEIDFSSKRSFEVNQADNLRDGYAVLIKSVNWDKKYVPFPYWPPSVHFGKMISGQAIFSKFPLLDSERIVLTGPSEAPFYYKAFYLDRLIQVARLSVNGKEIIVLNVHLEAFDRFTRENQAKEVLEVVERFADTPLILIGDFNARPPYASEIVNDEQTMEIFLNHPRLSSAIDKARYHNEEQLHFTYDTEVPYEKLDYILYTHKFIQPISASTVSEAGTISDHLPVFMKFILLDN